MKQNEKASHDAPDAQSGHDDIMGESGNSKTVHVSALRWHFFGWIALSLTMIIALDIAFTLAIEPYGSHSEAIWYEYRELTAAGERYDTIVIGSSVAQDGLQPGPLDETLATTSFCLASPGQSPWASLRALETALDDHPVKRVIFGTSYTALAEKAWPHSDMTCVQAQTTTWPLSQRIARYLELLTLPDYFGSVDSLAFLAPFSLNHVDHYPAAIMGNIRNRLECATPMEAFDRISPEARRLGRGYVNYIGEVDPTTFDASLTAAKSLAADRGFELNESKWAPVRQICDLCEERDVELVVVVMPHPISENVSLSAHYPTQMTRVQRYVEEHGGTYLDFSMAKAELYTPRMDEFLDMTHLSMAGAERFTGVLAQTIARVEADEDVHDSFFAYDDWDAYLASVDEIGFIYFESEAVADGLHLTAVSYPGTGIEVEYEYALKGADGSWQVLRPYATDPSFTLPANHFQPLELRLCVRRVGAQEPESTHYQTVSNLGT